MSKSGNGRENGGLIYPLLDFLNTELEPLCRVTFHSVMALKYLQNGSDDEEIALTQLGNELGM